MALIDKFNEWKASAVGRGMNPDNAYGYQCVDVFDDWGQFLFGKPWAEVCGYGNAKDCYYNAPATYWDREANNPNDANQLPKAGDVIVWDGWSGNQYGHIAVVVSADSSGVTVIEQDGFSPTKPAVLSYRSWNWHVVTGWLKPKYASSPAPAPSNGKQRTVSNVDGVNGRAQPNTSSAIVQVFAAGEVLDFNGYVKGQDPYGNGNNIWFIGAYKGNYFWSGAFDNPNPDGLQEVVINSPAPTPPAVTTPPPTTISPGIVDLVASDFPSWIKYEEKIKPGLENRNREAYDYYKSKGIDYPYKPIESHVHWWGDKATNPTHDGVVKHLFESSDVDSNLVVSENRVTKIVPLDVLAYTTGARNPYAWKTENDPKLTEGVYKTLGAVHYIFERKNQHLKNEAIRLHKEFMATACSDIDTNKVRDYVNKFASGELDITTGLPKQVAPPTPNPTPTPMPPSVESTTPPLQSAKDLVLRITTMGASVKLVCTALAATLKDNFNIVISPQYENWLCLAGFILLAGYMQYMYKKSDKTKGWFV